MFVIFIQTFPNFIQRNAAHDHILACYTLFIPIHSIFILHLGKRGTATSIHHATAKILPWYFGIADK
jgi:hypothetical protein